MNASILWDTDDDEKFSVQSRRASQAKRQQQQQSGSGNG
eukprot:CAMPEP_0182586862 /NCGR_PEP_ID=MMETSP1324-20130603/63731_1 /TAXON_ID=236786 /ORGANISM="Florenciella sp., Strain RCC1587" /LENGTH=38 /DNA_ID= /DNA_START= /DNA_END= /DNA_ORIENTATION=